MKVKVKTYRMPNLDTTINGYDVEELQEQIEDHIKMRLEDGYSLTDCVGGDVFFVLIFTKAD